MPKMNCLTVLPGREPSWVIGDDCDLFRVMTLQHWERNVVVLLLVFTVNAIYSRMRFCYHLIAPIETSYKQTMVCPLCNIQVRNERSKSSSTDILIAISVNKVRNVQLFVRTLRSTGSRCTCVILLDSTAYSSISPETRVICAACHVELVDMGNYVFNKDRVHLDLYPLISEYLKQNLERFQRVMIVDLHDSLFQGDPFDDDWDSNTLYFWPELIPGKERSEFSPVFEANIVLIRMWTNRRLYRLNERFIRCAGVLGGYTDIIMRVINLIIEFSANKQQGCDQGLLNFMYVKGVLISNNIRVNEITPNLRVRHSMESHGSHYEIGDIRGLIDESIYASIVHHVYDTPNTIISSLAACRADHLPEDSLPKIVHKNNSYQKFVQMARDGQRYTANCNFRSRCEDLENREDVIKWE